MTVVALHQTGVLLVDGVKSFPIGFSEAPPIGEKKPNGVPAPVCYTHLTLPTKREV
jgi:hypothetical protein